MDGQVEGATAKEEGPKPFGKNGVTRAGARARACGVDAAVAVSPPGSPPPLFGCVKSW